MSRTGNWTFPSLKKIEIQFERYEKMSIEKRKTPSVRIGNILMGSDHPVVIQSMTNTPTSDAQATAEQIRQLALAGSDLVRITVNDDKAMQAVPEIVDTLAGWEIHVPIIGDFHYNGHTLLSKYPEGAKCLAKYRINPGNVGKALQGQDNFAQIIELAVKYDKAVRIGVNWGSVDQEYINLKMDENAKRQNPLSADELACRTMVDCAIENAHRAQQLGLGKDRIVLSVKMSRLPSMVDVYQTLARECDYVLHVGLTEAGSGVRGVVSSTAACAVLLSQGIGDTIRVSLTPEPGTPRRREVDVCKELLQALEVRFFKPSVTSCPGCGRTSGQVYQQLAKDVNEYIDNRCTEWVRIWPGCVKMSIAVMGCVVNGPGESRHADIGISLPGKSENPAAPVYVDGKHFITLKDCDIKSEFFKIIEDYIRSKA